MRVAVCEVLGEILVRVLSGDGLDESGKADRDRFMDTIQEHLHDTNSHVRARVLQVYARVVNSKVSSAGTCDPVCERVKHLDLYVLVGSIPLRDVVCVVGPGRRCPCAGTVR